MRLLSIPWFFPRNSEENKLETKIVNLIEGNIDDLYARFNIDAKSQTYEKFEKLQEIGRYCYDKLSCLHQCPPKIETISAEKQIILKAIGDSTVKSYLAPYEFTRIRSSIEAILTQVVGVSNSSDNNFNRRLKDLSDLLSDEIEYCSSRPTFVTQDYYKPFLNIVSTTVNSFAERSKERFVCDIISTKGQSFTLDKKYPLHITGTEVRVIIPLMNGGPGIANEVVVHVSTENGDTLIHTEIVDLGGIGMGSFVIPITFEVFNPVKSLKLDLIVSWRVIGESEEKLSDFTVKIESQREDIDWNSLLKENPYSLEIARGENFYGRKDKIERLYSRIAQHRMQSSYITGQRRVGKSSLAKALEDKINSSLDDCHVLSIECGDFKHPDAISTVNALGENIEYFLAQHLSRETVWDQTPMNGSLAILSRLASILERTSPQKKFVFLIDEFDEINQDLYRNSEIAGTFFLNIRSLSGKRNLCFVLIGAEKMSFVMSSQGEKLNKFSGVSLDSFNQEEEWADYEDLIRGNLSDTITWHNNAIRSLYSITNGHPYFTKQICSKAFDLAVKSRDAEISSEEIDSAVKDLITNLDINAFQHFWRDGIQGNLDETEILSLKRCRVLVAIARTIRSGKPVRIENIAENIHSKQILEAEILPLLSDFCRRKIMIEKDQAFTFALPLFERWLVNQGFNHLISDQLGDELQEERQKQEDDAYITDSEINDLIYQWPNYKGMQITLHTVRDWLSQVSRHVDQRVLFKLLCNLRFFSDAEIRTGLASLHEKIKKLSPVMITKSKAQRRKDIWVTYVDGPGKSGAQFASLYAEVNLISTTCIKEISALNSENQHKKILSEGVSTIVIVDDFIGTGNGLSSSIKDFYERNKNIISKSKTTIILAVICSTAKGEDKVRKTLSTLDSTADLFVYETLDPKHFAFKDDNPIWPNSSDMLTAKELCRELGLKLDKTRPLGYGNDGLLLVFTRNCPNNTLPIINASGRGSTPWHPLFERIKH